MPEEREERDQTRCAPRAVPPSHGSGDNPGAPSPPPAPRGCTRRPRPPPPPSTTAGPPSRLTPRGQGLGPGPRPPAAAGASGPDPSGPNHTEQNRAAPRGPPAPSCAAPAPHGSVPRAAPGPSSSASSPLPQCRRPPPPLLLKPRMTQGLRQPRPMGARGGRRGGKSEPMGEGGRGRAAPLAWRSRAPRWVTWGGDARAGNRARSAPPRLKGPAARPCACAEALPRL